MDRILLMSLGSRGDMEPFLALGEELMQVGHEVAFCFPDQFRPLVAQTGGTFYPMDPAFIELVESPDVKKITGQVGSGWSRLGTILKLIRETKPLQQQLIRDQRVAVDAFQPDNIIFHIKCIYPVLTALEHGTRAELLAPVPGILHATDDEPAVGFGARRGRWWNRFTYKLANSALIRQAILSYGAPVAKSWGFKPLKAKTVEDFLLNRLPVEFAVSEVLFPQPNYWPEHVRVTGFRERNKSRHFEPSEALMTFLNNGPKPLYIGFGSMINARPAEVGKICMEVTAKLGQRVIINTSWGGIELPEELPDHVFAVNDLPFDWLFPKVRAAIHHGGSGTTHSALHAGIPQLIIPHIADQFFWMRRVHRAGLGPMGFPIKKFSAAALEPAMRDLLDPSKYGR